MFVFELLKKFIGIILTFISKSYLGIMFRFDAKFPYIFSYLLVSTLGTFYDQKYFLIYGLFFFMEHDTLSNVFNAIVYNITQLISVSSLGIVFVYVFCLVFFETYSLEMMSAQ